MMSARLSLIALAALAASGCTSLQSPEAPTAHRQKAAELANQRETMPVALQPKQRVVESTDTFIPVTPRKVSEHGWLRQMRVSLQVGNATLPMSEVIRMLSRQGLNIASELPLDRYNYTGYSLNDTDGETALRMVLSSAGLDYQADGARKLVTIKPMGSRTWYLNIGNRRGSYAAGAGASSGTSSGSSGGSSGGSASASTSSSSSGGSSGSGSAFASASGVQASATGGSSIQSSDDFWASLKTELEARLKVMMPDSHRAAAVAQLPAVVTGASPAPTANGLPPPIPVPTQAAAPSMSATPEEAGGMLAYKTGGAKQVGTYSLNPDTGAVTVQAPHWVLNDMDAYFKRIQEMYNTDITFQGELILLTSDKTQSEGLDVSAFAKFARSRYGLVYSNNALGGVTVSMPADGVMGKVSAGAQSVAGPLLGVSSALDGLQIFNAYLTNLGKLTTLQRPVLTTTSGVPADFRRTVTRYFNTVSQQAASGGSGSAAVGTQNQLIAQDFGTILRVNPRIDVTTGLIRAQIELVQTTQAGTQNITQSLTSGNSVQQVNTQLPVVAKILYSGEALLRDGDLVVMGGQTEDTENASRDGVTGLMDQQAVGGAFGKTVRSSERNTFYFALRVSTSKR